MSREASAAAASSASVLEQQRQQGEGSQGAEEGRTPLERTADTVEELYRLRDTFFPRDPTEKPAALRACADAALTVLDSLPSEQRKSPEQRALYEFLMGKILDVFPDYHKEAEDHLSKAVKLNPSLVDAWLCLGNCIWKKGDLASAKNCFLLALSKGADKKILCQLSMLERSMAQGSEDQALLVEESINHAKEAVMLDIKDGNSWYNLGNAYLTSFFVSGAWDHAKLHHSVKAYQNAEKDETMKLNPDLYYNCATADKYLENYERALRGFEAAALKDPGLSADTEVQKIISLLDKLENAMKGQLRSKRLASLVSSLSEVNLKSSHKKATISNLSGGLNKTVALLGKVVLLIRHDNVAPLYYLTCDSDQSYFILSVYGLQNGAAGRESSDACGDVSASVFDVQHSERKRSPTQPSLTFSNSRWKLRLGPSEATLIATFSMTGMFIYLSTVASGHVANLTSLLPRFPCTTSQKDGARFCPEPACSTNLGRTSPVSSNLVACCSHLRCRTSLGHLRAAP